MKLAILGATGAVGSQMIKCIEERNIDVDLTLLGSKKSAGKEIEVKICNTKKSFKVEEATNESFKNCDFVLGAVEADLAKQFAPSIVASKAIFIDNSSAFRMDKETPLVIPEINPEDVKWNKGIISNPNCSTIITDMAIYAINKVSKIKRMVTATYQAVSGAGVKGMEDLEEQTKYIALTSPENSVIKNLQLKSFKYQIAHNAIPCIGSPLDNGYTTEEMKMQNESRKILHLPDLKVTCTCVRVPVMRSHSIAVSMELEKKLSVEEIKNILEKTEGVKLVDDLANHKYPMPLNTTDKDIVEVGRIREDLIFDNGISLWCCGDQIRKGAATNAVQILELMIK